MSVTAGTLAGLHWKEKSLVKSRSSLDFFLAESILTFVTPRAAPTIQAKVRRTLNRRWVHLDNSPANAGPVSVRRGRLMNRRIPSAQRSAAHDGEIVVEREGGVTLRGQMWARNGSVTVTSSDGRRKSTWAGGSPRAIARLMLIELEEARLGNPMFKLAGE